MTETQTKGESRASGMQFKGSRVKKCSNLTWEASNPHRVLNDQKDDIAAGNEAEAKAVLDKIAAVGTAGI